MCDNPQDAAWKGTLCRNIARCLVQFELKRSKCNAVHFVEIALRRRNPIISLTTPPAGWPPARILSLLREIETNDCYQTLIFKREKNKLVKPYKRVQIQGHVKTGLPL